MCLKCEPASGRQTLVGKGTRMAEIEIDSSAFDRISLHDVRVYALLFQRGETKGNLVLDIDYIVEWPSAEDAERRFLMVPATLTFADVVDLQIHLDWGDRSIYEKPPHGVICCPSGELIISHFTRSTYTDRLYADGPEPYLKYELSFWEPEGARISLGARNFRIVGRQAPVRIRQPMLDPAQRSPLICGGG